MKIINMANVNTWRIMGQVGGVIKKENVYLINIAENKYIKKKGVTKEEIDKVRNHLPESTIPKEKYKPLILEKEYTIWYNCLCEFKPNVKTGDTIIAEGIFGPSKNPNYPFALIVKHVGLIKKKEHQNKLANGGNVIINDNDLEKDTRKTYSRSPNTNSTNRQFVNTNIGKQHSSYSKENDERRTNNYRQKYKQPQQKYSNVNTVDSNNDNTADNIKSRKVEPSELR